MKDRQYYRIKSSAVYRPLGFFGSAETCEELSPSEEETLLLFSSSKVFYYLFCYEIYWKILIASPFFYYIWFEISELGLKLRWKPFLLDFSDSTDD